MLPDACVLPDAWIFLLGSGSGCGSGESTHSILGARSFFSMGLSTWIETEGCSIWVGPDAMLGSSLVKRVRGVACGGVSTSLGCKESGSGVEDWEDRPTAGTSFPFGDSFLISVAGRTGRCKDSSEGRPTVIKFLSSFLGTGWASEALAQGSL